MTLDVLRHSDATPLPRHLSLSRSLWTWAPKYLLYRRSQCSPLVYVHAKSPRTAFHDCSYWDADATNVLMNLDTHTQDCSWITSVFAKKTQGRKATLAFLKCHLSASNNRGSFCQPQPFHSQKWAATCLQSPLTGLPSMLYARHAFRYSNSPLLPKIVPISSF